MHKIPSHAQLLAEVDKFNAEFLSGTDCEVTDDHGVKTPSRTTSPAWVMGDSAVIMVSGFSGPYKLSRVRGIHVKP